MKIRNLYVMFGLFVILIVVLSACGSGIGTGEVAPSPTPTPTEIASGGGDESPGDDEEDPVVPEPESPETPGEPDGVSDSCLIGAWVVDEEAFREYMTKSMNVTDAAQFEFGEIEGNFEMVIDEETMVYTSTEPAIVEVSLSIGGIELTSIKMEILGAGGAYWVTYEDLFIVYGQDYNFFGDGIGSVLNSDSIGQGILSVTLTPDLFISSAVFENVDISPVLELYPYIENYAVATFTCEGDVFTYQFGDYQSVWLRK